MGLKVDVERFACMAEAVAKYYNSGYRTIETPEAQGNDRRVMVKPQPGQRLEPMVVLTRVGFLDVIAEHH